MGNRNRDGVRGRRMSGIVRGRIGVLVCGVLAALCAHAVSGTAAVAADGTTVVQTSEVRRTANAYHYVSDEGRATFTVPWRDPTSGFFPGVTSTGNLLFWTEPGEAGTVVNYAADDTVKTETVGGTGTLDAYAADGSDEPIGTWTIPTGAMWSTDSPQQQIVLQLDEEHRDWAGTIRPLKVSLTVTDPASIITYLNSGVSTFYPLTLARTGDTVTVPVATQGAVGLDELDYTSGSCINATSAPSPSTGELTMNSCPDPVIALIDADGEDAMSVDMLDEDGEVVGTWSTDGQTISWVVTDATVLSVMPVHYSVRDTRGAGWSGWWDQKVTTAANIETGQTTTYDVAQLSFETEMTPASAEDASESTDPGVAVDLIPEAAAGTYPFGGDASITQFAVTPAPDDAAKGTWEVDGAGTVTFTPASGVAGTVATATFTVVSTNGTQASSSLTVTIGSSTTPVSPSPSPSPVDSETPSPSPSPGESESPSPSPSPVDSESPSPSESVTPSPSPVDSETPSPSPSPTDSEAPSPGESESPTPSPIDTTSPSPTASPTPHTDPSTTPQPSASVSPSDPAEPAPSSAPSASPSPTGSTAPSEPAVTAEPTASATSAPIVSVAPTTGTTSRKPAPTAPAGSLTPTGQEPDMRLPLVVAGSLVIGGFVTLLAIRRRSL